MKAHRTAWWLDMLIMYAVMAAVVGAVGYFLLG